MQTRDGPLGPQTRDHTLLSQGSSASEPRGSRAPTPRQGIKPRRRYVPRPELNPQPFGYTTTLKPTEPHWPETSQISLDNKE